MCEKLSNAFSTFSEGVSTEGKVDANEVWKQIKTKITEYLNDASTSLKFDRVKRFFNTNHFNRMKIIEYLNANIGYLEHNKINVNPQ